MRICVLMPCLCVCVYVHMCVYAVCVCTRENQPTGNPLAVPGLMDNAVCGALASLGLFGSREKDTS